VHQHDAQTFEVEFVSQEGETLALCALSQDCFIVVWRAETEQRVSIMDQVGQIVVRLPETPQIELLDFARFLSLRSAKSQS
jgi:hypothetical protein